MPPDTPAFRRLASRPAACIPRNRIVRPSGVHGPDGSMPRATQRHGGRSRSGAPCAQSDYRQPQPRHSTPNPRRLSGSARTYRWADNPVRGIMQKRMFTQDAAVHNMQADRLPG